jgi:hypothetical protein
LIPTIQLGQSDVNLTTYKAAMTFQGSFTTNLGTTSFAIAPVPTPLMWEAENKNPIVAPTPAAPTVSQDISSRYYYLTSYEWMVGLMNITFQSMVQNLYTQFQLEWASVAGLTTPFPYATLADFTGAVCNVPHLVYDPSTQLFSLYMDSRAFGTPIIPFTTTGAAGSLTASPVCRLFFNTNMQGLFANFPTIYWNTLSPLPASVAGNVPAFSTQVLPGYVYEVMVPNKFYQNIADYQNPPYGASTTNDLVPVALQQPYWVVTQDFPSTDTIWSPVASVVIASTLLPIRPEQVAQPTVLGTSTNGQSAPTSQSAFTPIITDVALDTTIGGASDYRRLISYVPSAEYRISDLTTSKTQIQDVDVQVYWKNRLDGQLIPITMYNLSSVHMKLMFRHKRIMRD